MHGKRNLTLAVACLGIEQQRTMFLTLNLIQLLTILERSLLDRVRLYVADGAWFSLETVSANVVTQ